MPTDHISSPACLRASTTSLPSMPFACFLKRSQSLSRKGETASRRILDFLFCLFATPEILSSRQHYAADLPGRDLPGLAKIRHFLTKSGREIDLVVLLLD